MFRMKHRGTATTVFVPLINWLESLIDECHVDGSGPGSWHGSHQMSLIVLVTDESQSLEHIITGSLCCSALVLLNRNLGRFESNVAAKWRLKERQTLNLSLKRWEQVGAPAQLVWDLLPYQFYTAEDMLSGKPASDLADRYEEGRR